jgi:hypothetical protein
VAEDATLHCRHGSKTVGQARRPTILEAVQPHQSHARVLHGSGLDLCGPRSNRLLGARELWTKLQAPWRRLGGGYRATDLLEQRSPDRRLPVGVKQQRVTEGLPSGSPAFVAGRASVSSWREAWYARPGGRPPSGYGDAQPSPTGALASQERRARRSTLAALKWARADGSETRVGERKREPRASETRGRVAVRTPRPAGRAQLWPEKMEL